MYLYYAYLKYYAQANVLSCCMISCLLMGIEIIFPMLSYRKAHVSESVTTEINLVSLLMFQLGSTLGLLSLAKALQK